ncbi:MAG TPA: LapA family protein [Longimicrobiaceae bacterium]
MSRRLAWRWAALALIALLAALFASFNTGERVALDLGFTTLYRVPLVPLIFLAFLLGMVTMFLVGLRHDLRVRRALREAGFAEVDSPHRPRRSPPVERDRLADGVDPGRDDSPGWVSAPRPHAPPAEAPPPGGDGDAEPPPRYPP